MNVHKEIFKMKKLFFAVLCGTIAMAMTGCSTSSLRFLESSAPVPDSGYTIVGSEVTGTSDQIWVLGIGGSTDLQQSRAYRDALAKAQKADALVSMSIEEHWVNVLFFAKKVLSVTGTPVKFNANK